MRYLPSASYVLHAIPRCKKGKRLGLHPLENYKMNRSGFLLLYRLLLSPS